MARQARAILGRSCRYRSSESPAVARAAGRGRRPRLRGAEVGSCSGGPAPQARGARVGEQLDRAELHMQGPKIARTGARHRRRWRARARMPPGGPRRAGARRRRPARGRGRAHLRARSLRNRESRLRRAGRPWPWSSGRPGRQPCFRIRHLGTRGRHRGPRPAGCRPRPGARLLAGHGWPPRGVGQPKIDPRAAAARRIPAERAISPAPTAIASFTRPASASASTSHVWASVPGGPAPGSPAACRSVSMAVASAPGQRLAAEAASSARPRPAARRLGEVGGDVMPGPGQVRVGSLDGPHAAAARAARRGGSSVPATASLGSEWRKRKSGPSTVSRSWLTPAPAPGHLLPGWPVTPPAGASRNARKSTAAAFRTARSSSPGSASRARAVRGTRLARPARPESPRPGTEPARRWRRTRATTSSLLHTGPDHGGDLLPAAGPGTGALLPAGRAGAG